MQRAAAAEPDFELTSENAAAMAAKCGSASTDCHSRSNLPPRASRSCRPPLFFSRASPAVCNCSPVVERFARAPTDTPRRDRLELRPPQSSRTKTIPSSLRLRRRPAISKALKRLAIPRPILNSICSMAWLRSSTKVSFNKSSRPMANRASSCSRPFANTPWTKPESRHGQARTPNAHTPPIALSWLRKT